MNRRMIVLIGVGLLVIAALGFRFGLFDSDKVATLMPGSGLTAGSAIDTSGKPTVIVKVPEFGQIATLGEEDFNNDCAVCHGTNAAGTSKGPPLIHRLYVPGHHADIAFKFARDKGVRAHHWPYGNMPPQKQVTDQELARIVVYIRELQRANGIQ